MRKSCVLLGLAAFAVLLATSASAANRGVTFTGIGFIEDPGPFPASAIWDMNPQGTVFMASPTWFGNYCFTWTRENGWGTEVGQSDNYCRISAEGTIMGTGLVPGSDPAYLSAGTWAGAPNLWNPIPFPADYAPCGQDGISLYDIGGNGDFATGLTWYGSCDAGAFRWDKATNTTVNLGSPNGDSGRGNAISNDGNTIVGWGSSLFGDWRGARWDNGTWSWIDGQGNIEPKACNVTGKPCTFNGDDPVYGCPDEFVDDASCQNMGDCSGGVCVGGVNAGQSCSGYWECGGSCVGGPGNGDYCYYDGMCPDTEVCVANPAWSDAAYKGEARDISDSGHVVGRTFSYDWSTSAYLSAYRQNPNGSFTEIPTAPSFPDSWEPARISEDGKTVVGMIGNPWWGSIPAFWNEGMGTQDLQLFLVQQGLDELFFWYLTQINDVSADGTVMAGKGYNPDGWQEGFVVDLKKVWVCHAPSGNPANARTLGVSFGSVGDHVAHGDFLGTCEFLNSGGRARSTDFVEQRNQRAATEAAKAGNMSHGVNVNPFFGPQGVSSWSSFGRSRELSTPVRERRTGGMREHPEAPARSR